jgi:hypothetical protein
MNTNNPISITRRSTLGGIATMAIPLAGEAAAARPSLEDVLATFSPAERVRYHSKALMEAMSEMHPGRRWRSQIEHDCALALVVGMPIGEGRT